VAAPAISTAAATTEGPFRETVLRPVRREPTTVSADGGVTLDQIDEINLLLSSLRALGNVVTCDHAERFVRQTPTGIAHRVELKELKDRAN
jgi:hypothetical protein